MKHYPVNRLYVGALCCSLMMAAGCGLSSTKNSGDTELLSVVAISRHGIRSPTSSVETLNQYTSRPEGFPLWPAPADVPGNLSTVGQQNVTRLGAWYRDFYAAQGLLPQRGSCPAAGSVFAYADVDERTIQTAQGYLDGLFQSEATPDCGVQVISSSKKVDPYIVTFASGKCQIDTAADLVAFNARIGSPAALATAYSTQLQTLQAVTQSTLLELPATVATTGYVRFAKGSLFDVSDNITETFQLEYAQGMPDKDCEKSTGAQCVGWGAIPPGGLNDMMKLHVMNMELYSGLPSFAQVGSTNLMWQVAGTMNQALSGAKNPDMLAPAESKFTLFVAHDVNISAIAAFLGGVTWKAKGFQQNDPGPAGALVFELHKVKRSGQLIVRLFYVIASLDQMRHGTTLSLKTPPQRIPLTIPACGGRYDCPYDQFTTFITTHVRQDCLITATSAP
jgi:4-phytase / acid phosphatase